MATLSWADRLEACYSGAVYDVLRELKLTNQVLPPEIRPIKAGQILAGKIFPVSGHLDNSLSAHESLLRWTKMLAAAPAGHVIVCQPHDHSLSHMGELSAQTLKFKGVRGYVVDGGCRDTRYIQAMNFPVFCRYTTPKDIVGRWTVDRTGEPIEIGGVAIHRGDYLLADQDGAVVIPAKEVDQVVTRTEAVLRTESLVRSAILNGVDPQEAYLKFGKF